MCTNSMPANIVCARRNGNEATLIVFILDVRWALILWPLWIAGLGTCRAPEQWVQEICISSQKSDLRAGKPARDIIECVNSAGRLADGLRPRDRRTYLSGRTRCWNCTTTPDRNEAFISCGYDNQKTFHLITTLKLWSKHIEAWVMYLLVLKIYRIESFIVSKLY